MHLVELKPYRQKWLSLTLLHSAPHAKLVWIDDKQYAQLEHPKGGPLCCVICKTNNAIDIIRKDNKWYFLIED